MRRAACIAVVLALTTAPAEAQWQAFASADWRFAINFPGEPESHEVSYISPGGTRLKGHEFSLEREDASYRVKIIDFAPRASDESRAIAQVAATLRWRGTVSFDAKDDIAGIPGHLMNLIEPDGWHTRVGIYFFKHFLYIAESSAAPGRTPPAQFPASIEVLYPDGSVVDLTAEAAERVRTVVQPKLSGKP